MTHKNRWLIQPPITPEADAALAKASPVLRQLLFNRGIDTEERARAFLRGEANFVTDPFAIMGMQAAVERIHRALTADEQIVVYGDYDVDGVTATALLVEALQKLGGHAHGYIPNRFEEGYGLNNDALTQLASEGVKLVITVDCGIRSPAEALHARTLGLDLIISDHHEPSGDIPEALAVINPKQPGDTYPEKYLAGVGLAYKIVEALAQSVEHANIQLSSFLDLVALGTVADLAPLAGENRILVRQGLKQMRETRRQGLFSLAAVAGVTLSKITAQNIGFSIGPRLNAAGRLNVATDALNLLLSTDPIEAGSLAQSLNNQNVERQRLTKEIQVKAEELALEGQEEDPILLFAAHPDFNHGIVGLAASRLLEKYYRPAIIGHYGEETTRCSCRSIQEFNITAALDECADLLVRHGGHRAAAGFTVRNQNLEELVTRLRSIAKRELDGLDLRSTFTADMEVVLSELNSDTIKYLDYLQPTGYGNPEVIFVSRSVKVVTKRTVGADGGHLKLTLSDGRTTYDAIAFRMGGLASAMPPFVDVLFSFETNEYNGRVSLQLNIKDIKPASEPD